jgi:serine/threonine protein kinase/tetratricopeptide (TPR) repeat protein
MAANEEQAKSVFLAALERSADQWPGLLDEACRGNAELRARVEQLLYAHQAMGEIGGQRTQDRGQETLVPISEGPGTLIGTYKLLQQIGEGGFGLVYMAEQERPVRRTVALKIIKPGMDSAQVIARFESERQALALMDHPNVAKVLDAGATQSGHPYFVMELVKGVPITEFCDKNHLPPEERLKLFLDVCHAIQHAHQKGVIHRDIKPTNVMVTLHDGMPVVKVIDFGVAKATAQKLTERTLFTAYGQMVGTPAYMSPEQAEMSGLDVDTRTDVYSLGVLLYELLTGTTPLKVERLREAGYAEMQRMIREEEAPKPSTRLSSLKGSATILAGNRGLDVKQLVRLLSGDLDWIAMKSLEKDRNRRYATPGNFAEDIERYLRREAIAARPPSTAYRMKKFAQRNRVAVLTSAVVAVALVAGSAIATWQAVLATRAQREALAALAETERARADESVQRERAEANEQKALKAVAAERRANEVAQQNERKAAQQRDLAKARFRLAREAVDQYHTRVSENPELKAKGLERLRTELLEAAAKFYDKFVQEESDDPEVQAERGRAFRRLADLYADTGHQGQAEHASAESLKIFNRLSANSPEEPKYKREQAQSHRQAGLLHNRANRFDQSARSFHAAIDIQRQLVTAYPNVPDYQADLAETLDNLGAWSFDDRRDAWHEATALARRLVASHGGERRYQLLLAALLNDMGFFHLTSSRTAEAITWLEEALPVARGLKEAHPQDPELRDCFCQVAGNLAQAYQKTDQLERAEPLMRESVALAKQSAAEHPLVPALQISLLGADGNLAALYRKTKRTAVAEKTLEEGLALARRLISAQPDDGAAVEAKVQAVLILNQLAFIRSQTGRPAQAVTTWNEACALLKQAGEQSPAFALDEDRLAQLYRNFRNFLRQTHQDDLANAAVKDEVNYVLKLAEKYPQSEQVRSILLSSVEKALSDTKKGELQTGLFRQVVEEVQKLRTQHPREQRFAVLHSKVLARMGEDDEALKCLLQLTKPEWNFSAFEEVRELVNGRAGRPNQKSLIEKADQAFARTRYYLDWCAAQGHWSEAVAESEKRIRANPDDHYSWYRAAFVFAVQGESARYRRHCAEMLARFGSTKEAAIAERITKASLILPPESATLEKAQVLAERAVTIGANDDLSRFFQLAHALADFRAGQFDVARQWLDQCLRSDKLLGDYCTAMARLLSAMTYSRLHNDDKAQSEWALAQQCCAKLPSLERGQLFHFGDWHDGIGVLLLRREAEKLLGRRQPVDSKTKRDLPKSLQGTVIHP